MAKEVKNKEKKAKPSKGKSSFVKDTKAELKKVIWPSSKQLINNTVAVITIVVVIGVIVFALDLCFDKINAFGIDKLKAAVQSENAVNEVGEETVDEVDEDSEENLEGDDAEHEDTEESLEDEEETIEAEETESETEEQ